MAETSSELRLCDNNNHIPIEIVSDEEMALIEAAFALASSARSSASLIRSSSCSPSSSSSSSSLPPSPLSIKSITILSKKRLSTSTANSKTGSHPDIEDSPKLSLNAHKKKTKVPDSFLHRFRRKRGLSVTDLTAAEWCQKQMEFSLLLGGRRTNQAMRAGIARHAKLEEEVIKRVPVKVKSQEDLWALKFLNFIHGVNQLLFEGLTRELPIIGFAEGTWMVGVIDEIRMPVMKDDHNPILVDTKTRARDTLPAEPQRRNGRLQLMCYKYLWDKLVADDFPSKNFFTSFGLNPHLNLSEDLKVTSDDSGYSASTLDDVVRLYKNTCKMLAPAHDQLLLRYEYQKDQSLLGEDKFAYDSEWLKDQIRCSLEFWHGTREATYAPEEERWKCKFCQFASVCPAYNDKEKKTDDCSNNRQINMDYACIDIYHRYLCLDNGGNKPPLPIGYIRLMLALFHSFIIRLVLFLL